MAFQFEVKSNTAARIFPIGLFILGFFFAFHPMILAGFRVTQTDAGDTRMVNFLLENGFLWVSEWLTASPLPRIFWDAPFFFPTKNVTAYSELMLSSAPIYWFWRAVHFNPQTAYQLWLMSCAALNYFTMFVCLRNGPRIISAGAAVGAFYFAFASSRIVQLEHSQLQPHFFVPIALLALFKIFQYPSSKKWVPLFFLSWVGQLYASFYLGWLSTLALGFCAIFGWHDILKKRIFSSSFVGWILVIMGFSALLLFPMVSHYLAAAKTIGMRPIGSIFPPKIQSWFYLGSGSWLYFWQDLIRGFQVIDSNEQKIGIGFFSTVLAVIGLWRQKSNRWVRALLCGFLILLVLTTQFYRNIYLWPHAFPWIPGAIAIRALSRIGLIFLIPISFGIALFFAQYRSWKGWAAVLLLICLLEQGRTTKTFENRAAESRSQSIAARVSPQCQSFFYYFDRQDTRSSVIHQIDAMWASLIVGIPTINGYSGGVPPGWGWEDHPDLSKEARLLLARTWLKQWIEKNHLDPEKTCWIE